MQQGGKIIQRAGRIDGGASGNLVDPRRPAIRLDGIITPPDELEQPAEGV
ncbi:uncharacterized protein METZ01_LOCUS264942, partial [marine metagenome]